MRVDFYQLGSAMPDRLIAGIAARLLASKERLLIVAADGALVTRLDRQLWDQDPASFLPHGIAGEGDDASQPVLLSTGTDAPNRARNLLIADGQWREAALSYDRAFFLFDGETLGGARKAWRSLAESEGVERNYWAHEEGRWTRKG